MMVKKMVILSILLLVTMPAMGFGFDVTAHVDRTRISTEDSLSLTVEVDGGKADLDLSGIRQFKVISRGSASSYNYINGKSERKATYNYVLVPLAKGELKIPAISATRDGKTFFTREIVIHVTDQVAAAADDVKSLFARASVNKKTLFAGEQAVYTLRFFTSKRLSGLGFEKPPGFKDLSPKPFEKERTYTQTINGILYRVTQVHYLITPAAPGSYTIDPAVLMANVMVKTKRDPRFESFFNDSFFSSDSYKPARVVSNPLEIKVSPLPLYQGTKKFSGLVGSFDIKAEMDNTRFKAGESGTLTVKISGSGNIMDAGLPEMDLTDDAFKVYDDTPVETIHLTETGYEGVKIFKKAIVPVIPGEFVIRPMELVYFDVDKKSYQTVSTDEIRLDIIPSGALHQASNPAPSPKDKSVEKQTVSLVNKDILEIREGLEVLKDYREIKPVFFVLFLSIPALLFSGVKVFILASKKDVSVEKVMTEKAKHHFKQAEKMAGPEKGFLGHLYSALVAIILAKGGKKGETVTLREAQTILINAKVDSDQIDEITRLLETIESARFGGRSPDKNRAVQLLSKTKQMMKLLCLAVVCLGIFSFAPPEAMANTATTFTDGIRNYKAGNFKQAAHAFETMAKTSVKNPYLYYNIANAYLKAGNIGRAVLWYERAKVMIPNDPDLNFNLAHANSLVKDKKEGAVPVMDVLFFWDRLVSNKTLQITAIFFSFVFFSWAAIKVVKKQRIFSGAGMIIFSLFFLFTAISFANYYKRSVRITAVIVQEEVAVRSGMAKTATKLFTLHAGSKVRVTEQKNGYLKIWFSKGKVGWIAPEDAVII